MQIEPVDEAVSFKFGEGFGVEVRQRCLNKQSFPVNRMMNRSHQSHQSLVNYIPVLGHVIHMVSVI